MRRPTGVIVIVVLNVLGGVALTLNETLFSPERLQSGLLGILIVVLLFSLAVSVALLKLQNWARWVTVVLYGLSLVRIPGEVMAANNLVDAMASLIPALYLLWAIWYLFRPHVKAAFGSA